MDMLTIGLVISTILGPIIGAVVYAKVQKQPKDGVDGKDGKDADEFINDTPLVFSEHEPRKLEVLYEEVNELSRDVCVYINRIDLESYYMKLKEVTAELQANPPADTTDTNAKAGGISKVLGLISDLQTKIKHYYG